MGEQGTTQLPAPRSSPPAQGGGGKRASVARTVEAATPIRQAISRVGMAPTNFTKHFAHMAHCGPLCWHQVPLWTAKGTGLCRLRHGAPPTAPALDRAAIDANDRSEPSISTTIAARQTRRPRKRSGARVSRIPVVKIPSGSVPPISNRYNATTAVPQGLPPPFQSATWSLCSSCQTARKCLCHRHCSVVAV